MTALSPDIFRTYDIRAIADTQLNDEAVVLIANALTHTLNGLNQRQLIIGRDGRLSSPRIFKTLCDALLALGVDVIDVGVLPTPLLYYACNTLDARSAIMITASHNPAEYNGIKLLFDRNVSSSEAIKGLYDLALKPAPKAKTPGQYTRVDTIIKNYCQSVMSRITLENPPKVVIDYSNGATCLVAPQLFRALGCEVIDLYENLDGHFPNHEPEPTQPKNLADLIQKVKDEQADLGIAFDGDGDRMVAVTNEGEMIFPDRMLALFAQDTLKKMPGKPIVYDVKCSYLLKRIIEEADGEPVLSATGHTLIKGLAKKVGAALAGEMSGHFIFYDRWFDFDDGIYAGVRFLELLNTQSMDEIKARLIQTAATPEIQMPVAESDKAHIMSALSNLKLEGATMITVDGVRAEWPDGFALVRPSNTTPCLVFRFEASDQKKLERLIGEFKQAIMKLLPELSLPF
ncbi:MAG: phosphomannomutase/phosphoglucomutase [Gammaproteobacteria bacterium CG11_big_fil_rev_8_21_14_0_20_46_22]|nr:MAG: phosphomannomutase/phosphoglucomutase [Gammaproteobacteria bacterium CG12_big_fil_rev_8_21_14_0_65_46_12]PIR11039.1 MAG: phosphomannomutase/phosphoglucomutase [Gammaproteobacteria bacterium CG11_big_fil_rev_8_21_14_0_20_46_22]